MVVVAGLHLPLALAIVMSDDELQAAKTACIRVHGKEEGFYVDFSSGTKVSEMTRAELLQRLLISEPFAVDDHLKSPDVYHESLIEKLLSKLSTMVSLPRVPIFSAVSRQSR